MQVFPKVIVLTIKPCIDAIRSQIKTRLSGGDYSLEKTCISAIHKPCL